MSLLLLVDVYNDHLQYKCGDGDNWRDTWTAASLITPTVTDLTGCTIYTCYVKAKHSPEAPLSVEAYTACSGNICHIGAPELRQSNGNTGNKFEIWFLDWIVTLALSASCPIG